MSSADVVDGPVTPWRVETRSTLASFGHFCRSHPGVVAATAFVIGLVLAGLFLPLPYSPTRPESSATLQPPNGDHIFGTDRSGFDVYSRTIAAAALDLPLAIAGTLLSLLVGVPLGLLASSRSRWADITMRGLDIFQAFPLLLLAIVIVALAGNDLRIVVVAIALINVPRFIRLTRSEALTLRSSRFIEAARAIGASGRRVTFRHLLPNIVGSVSAQAALTAAHAIVVIAALSFIGVGVSPPDPSWGAMIKEGAQSIATGQWWVSVAPGVAVFLCVISFNVIADGLLHLFERSQH